MAFFSGRVQQVKFQREDLYILQMRLDNGREVMAKGNVFGLAVRVGVWFGFEGHWETHPKYGPQLAMDRAPQAPPGQWAGETCAGMLRSAGVPDILVEEILGVFGDDTSRALTDKHLLRSKTRFTDVEIDHLQASWLRMCGIFETMERLESAKFTRHAIRRMWAKFDDLAELLMTNPWRLLELPSVTLEQTDHLAHRFAVPLTSPFRTKGIMLSTLRQGQLSGHVFLPMTEVVPKVLGTMEGLSSQDIFKALVESQQENLLVLDQKTKPGTLAVYSPWLHTVETIAARMLLERMRMPRPVFAPDKSKIKERPTSPEEWREMVLSWVGKTWTLSEEQLRGAVMALQEPVCVVTGLPGTGKTTLLKVVSRMLVDFGVQVLLVAPTGIAAKRMNMVTGLEAMTIHRAFGARSKQHLQEEAAAGYGGVFFDDEDDLGEEDLGEWGFTPQHPHSADVVFIDEASMVDAHLLYRILVSTKPTCRLVFIGDVDQLPSVGPGQVLSNLIQSNLFPVVSLREVFRQHEQSGIIRASHAIVRGEVPALDEVGKDFIFVPLDGEDQILDALLQLVTALYKKKAEFQVLSPRHGGILGVTNLNESLRSLLNPKQAHMAELKVGNRLLRQGDRIMITKNDYTLDAYNGDVGKISAIQKTGADGFVELKLYGSTTSALRVPMEKVGLLKLAYAMTVHKSQGQEYENILLPWVKGFGQQLVRNLLYTAITRAKRKVYLLGHFSALQRAVYMAQEQVRHTLLIERMWGDGKPERPIG